MYKLKLTKLNEKEIILDDIKEFVFAKNNLYYMTNEDEAKAISRKDFDKAWRNARDKWLPICIKKF